jgi:hypothetical protein
MQNPLASAALAGLLTVAGCARDQAPPARPPSASGPGTASTNAALIVTPEEGLNGKVSSVNSNLRFVVITFPVGQMSRLDQRLNLYRHGLKVGEVKISGPQSDDNIVADIVSGEAAIGDAVRDR